MVDLHDDGSLDHQGMATVLIDAFADHDATGLDSLDAAGRSAQLRSRQALHDNVDRMWEDAKARGLNPATRPEWSAVAGLRDLASALVDQTMQAQSKAGDEDAE